ncbi:TetR/AcrR family transcriptional regulator [Spiractinospora alimapuensis]|uniref:TetR/AcrR family transcriptional regulator n=1 Tax=Spiractinospora alimapuensis TaxID=2820884 RepID=UPI001F26A3A6|nr:TetR/AcrR family transcriptional regulator [Spiractinospora alimapuensis]QVQ51219.1 TetR/AcrR family transcriptional regulator [Spiractinospora alimapuensis]
MTKPSHRPDDAPHSPSRSDRKRAAILSAAEAIFLVSGYLATNMDEVASRSGVSKQTIYKHFGNKEALFVEIVTRRTREAGDHVHFELPEPELAEDVVPYLSSYAYRQLSVVLTPELMSLRRLVVGEVSRFPDLARVLYEHGPQRAVDALAESFTRIAARGLLRVDNPTTAATHFNWLVMGEPVNRAMLLGDSAIPTDTELRAQAHDAVRVFMAAYGPRTIE